LSIFFESIEVDYATMVMRFKIKKTKEERKRRKCNLETPGSLKQRKTNNNSRESM